MAPSPLIDFPEDFFRNALDLNRFETGVAHNLVKAYNRIILDTVSKLDAIERSDRASQPSYRAKRLRALLAQLKKSLDTWSEKSSDSLIEDLDGIARLQSDFVVGQLKKALPAGAANSVRTVEISKAFAESVVKSNPLELNAALLTKDIEAIAKGVQAKFTLTSKQGSQIVLPNNKSLRQNFRGLAANQANRFGNVVRDGLLTGETTSELTRRLAGTLDFNEPKLTLLQTKRKGGTATTMANSQIETLVRTTVNQVSNEASQSVYRANQDITEKYKWVATLDERTSPQCRLLDGQEFEYGKGPTPPYHFNCRCTTVAVIDYEKQGIDPPNLKIGRRAAQGGSVERGTDAAEWLKNQSDAVKARALGGKKKVEYFNYLTTRKKNPLTPKEAISKMLRGDQTEKSLDELKRSYGINPGAKPTIKRPKIAGPGTPPLRLTPNDPRFSKWDPDEVLRKAQADRKNYLGSGAFGSAYLVDGNPPAVLKKGQFGRYEVEALEKLKGTGITPTVLSQKYTTGWEFPRDWKASGKEVKGWDYKKIREGSVVMTRAKGKPVDDLLGVFNEDLWGDFNNPRNLKQRDFMVDEYIKARKIMHMKGISHNDMHGGNFFFDTKTNKGTVIDFGLAQMNPKAALVEAIGYGTGGDETAQLLLSRMLGDRDHSTHKLLNKLGHNIVDVKLELEKRGLDDLAMEMLDWETGSNFLKAEYAALSDDLARELLDVVYDGI